MRPLLFANQKMSQKFHANNTKLRKRENGEGVVRVLLFLTLASEAVTIIPLFKKKNKCSMRSFSALCIQVSQSLEQSKVPHSLLLQRSFQTVLFLDSSTNEFRTCIFVESCKILWQLKVLKIKINIDTVTFTVISPRVGPIRIKTFFRILVYII